MTRLAIVVEGPTEREFVQRPLAEYLLPREVYPSPISLGGNVTVSRLASEMARLLWNFDCVSSLVDYYGFRGKGNATPTELENHIKETVNSRTNTSPGDTRIFPYVQRHEFEGLLFSHVDAFSETTLASNANLRQLRQIRSGVPTPEDINDNPQTAPSKRIEQIIPRYNKPAHGFLIAESIGVDTIRSECPRFNEWLARLESLGGNPVP